MLVDNVTIKIKAGSGGNGAATLSRTAQTAKGGPDGGNGGNGGNVYIQGSNNIRDLSHFRYKKKISAEDGEHGAGKNHFGKNASDITVFVPLGTVVTDVTTDRTYEIVDTVRTALVARGGVGGKGNFTFRSSTNRTPMERELGQPGEEKILLLDLRLIAEAGLIGLPNAGKSSLLSVMTNAKPQIGAYPFTTLEPNIGMLDTHPIADIPGLIEGAASGKGLGIKFLKHIDKTKVLVHCIDLSADTNPMEAYKTVREELKKYNDVLLGKRELVVLNKTDLVDADKVKKSIAGFKKGKHDVLPCSVYDPESVETVKNRILHIVKEQ